MTNILSNSTSIYFPCITATCILTIYLHFFEKFDAMSNSAIVHHNLHVAIQNGTCSLFIHEKQHEKDLLD